MLRMFAVFFFLEHSSRMYVFYEMRVVKVVRKKSKVRFFKVLHVHVQKNCKLYTLKKNTEGKKLLM